MFLYATIALDPSDPTQQYDPAAGQESETFSTSSILQRLTLTMRNAGVTNAMKLVQDGTTLFEDQEGHEDDLTEAMRSFARHSSARDKQEFDDLQLVLEHEGPLVRSVIEARIECIHAADVYPIVLTIAGFLKEYRADDGQLPSARQQLLNSIFRDQAGYDAVTTAADDEFQQLVKNIAAAGRKHIGVDAARVGSRVRIVRNATADEDAGSWRTLFDHPGLTQDDVLYCYDWHRTCEKNRITTADCELVDADGSVQVPQQPVARAVADTRSGDGGQTAGNPFVGLTLSSDDISSTSWFGGPKQADIWEAVSETIGGQFEKGGLFSRHKVHWRSGSRLFRLEDRTTSDENSTCYQVRMEAGVAGGRNRVICRVHADNIISTLGKMLFKTQDIEIGDADFDKGYIVKGSNELLVRDFLGSRSLRALITMQPSVVVSIGRESVRLESGCTHDPHLLLRLFELMYELQDRIDAHR